MGGWGWRWGGGMATTTVDQIPVEQLVVDIGDALLVSQYDVRLRQCGQSPFTHAERCDVNRDNACDIGDALRMAQCDVGLISCTFTCNPFTCP